ncbi:MAG TPA: HyaD/HybD family hydrogenase maturation endopeptidase [Casimicrobiaceae bacterium]|nr:HyaD/HybD family hydrogenase maturation endopeptidase [Casimicrobiaceae bacterium]
MATNGGRRAALVIGIGNVLWADEGFGVRAVEALHAAFAFPDGVALMDGGTLGLALYDEVARSDRVLVFDAVDYALAPGTLKVLRGDEVPAWGRTKLSPHQVGFNDVLGLAALQGRGPHTVTVIGVQPEVLDDFGGSLRPVVRARLDESVALAAAELARWGLAGRRRDAAEQVEPLNDAALSIDGYETGRPSEQDACRIGDARVIARSREGGG